MSSPPRLIARCRQKDPSRSEAGFRSKETAVQRAVKCYGYGRRAEPNDVGQGADKPAFDANEPVKPIRQSSGTGSVLTRTAFPVTEACHDHRVDAAMPRKCQAYRETSADKAAHWAGRRGPNQRVVAACNVSAGR
jgi:hypothetical protein